MLLAGRVRKSEEALTIQNILEKHFKRTVNPEALFSEAQVTTQFSRFSPRHTFTYFLGLCLTTWPIPVWDCIPLNIYALKMCKVVLKSIFNVI